MGNSKPFCTDWFWWWCDFFFFFFLTPLNLISGPLLLMWCCNAVLFLTKSDHFRIKVYNINSKHFVEVTLFPRKKNLVIFRLRKRRSHKILSISDSDDSGIKSTLLFTAVLYVHVVFEDIPLLAKFCKKYVRKYFLSVPFLHGCV